MGDYPSQNPNALHTDASLMSRMAVAKESVWFRIGVLHSTMNDRDRALDAFERVLTVNPANVRAMTQAGAVLAKKECYPQAVAYLQRAIQADSTCGEAWAVLAHCYVMTDDLQKAYQAYQSALSHLPNPRDPNLWYGIGLLYDRYGSLDHALEAFLLVLSIAPEFERADEVCFCIGIIYKEQQNFDEALKYFNKVVVAANPPPPLTRADGWYQIGHVSELKRDIPAALEMYKQALAENPKHPKTLQNYGWLEHQHNNKSSEAIRLLKMSAELDSTDGQTWYLLGRVYMALREFRQAYDAYQQAVYRDSRNATFWCSIGVLYYQMNQYRDAMDAYSRAIILNPHVSEVWYDLGTLYESCGQNDDAIDAYRRAAKLAPENTQITARLAVLENNATQSNLPPQAQQPESQPSQSAPQNIPHSQPQQRHSEVQQGNMLGDINQNMNRPFGQPLQPVPNPTRVNQPQQSSPPAHLHPPAQMGGPTSSLNQRQSVLGVTGTTASGPIEMAPIPFLQSRVSDSQPPTSSFHQMDRQTLRPGSLPSVSHSATLNGSNMSHLNSVMPHSHPSHGPSSILPHMPNSSAPDSMNVMPLHSSPGSQMPNSSHQSLHHNDGMPPFNNISSKDPQSGGHHQNSTVGQMSSPKQSQVLRSPQKGPSHSDQQDGSGQNQQTPYESSVDGRNQGTQHQGQQSVTSPGQHSIHSLPSQPQNSLSQIPSLQPISGLGPVQQQSNDEGERSDRHRMGLSGPGDDQDRNSAIDTGATGPHYGPGDNARRNDYEGQDQHDDSRLRKLSRPDSVNEGGGGGGKDVESNARSGFSGPLANSAMRQSRDRIPSIRDTVGDGGNSDPNGSRQMNIRDVTPSEAYEDARRHGSQRHESSQHDERESSGQNGRDAQQQNGASDGKSDRLPSMNSLPAPMDMNSNRNGQGDNEMQGPAPQVSPPSLSLPSSNGLPSMSANDNGKPINSQNHGSSPGTGSGMGTAGASLPPLSSGRNSTPLNRLGQESKDMNSSAGMSSGLVGLGSSSLSKFGRGPPPTPVSNSVVSASLPSPLSARKPNNSSSLTHSGRSPRLSKPVGGFKPMGMGVSNSNYGPMEQVPSPGSLPVLPPMNSRPGNYSEDEKVVKDKRVDDGERESEHHGDGRSKFGDEKVDKDMNEGGGHGRVTDVLENKPVFGVLRPGNSSGDKDAERGDSDDKMKSPVSSPTRGNTDSVLSSKRESMSKEDIGRTPKRPRLHDVNEKEMSGKSYGYDGNDESEKGKEMSQRKEDELSKNLSGMNKSDVKGERRSGNTPQDETKKHLRRDSGGRTSDGEMGKSGLSAQMIVDLPRLSNPAMPKLSGPPLSGNQPLPSFRSERKNLTASRGSSGTGGVGKSMNTDNSTRGSLPFALRSAPVSSIPSLKSIGGGSSGRGSDHGEYESSPRMGESGSSKRVVEDKNESSMTRNGGRDRD